MFKKKIIIDKDINIKDIIVEEKTKKEKKNIFKEMQRMGAAKSVSKIIFNFILYTSIMIVLGYYHHLDPIYIIIIAISLLLIQPYVLYTTIKYNYEKRRFEELCTYFKYINVNYKISNKVYSSLKETYSVFDDGSEMKTVIGKAIAEIEKGTSLKESLAVIEKAYPNAYLKQINTFMVLGEEKVGRASYKALSQVNYQEWKKDKEIYELTKGKVKTRCIYFSFGSLLMSWYLLGVLKDLTDILFVDINYQMVTFVTFMVIIVQYVYCLKLLTSDWIEEDLA